MNTPHQMTNTQNTSSHNEGFVQVGNYVDELLKRARMWDGVDEETRNNARLQLFDQVIDRLGVVMLQHMDGAALAEFANRSKEQELSPEETLQFYQEKIPDFVTVMQQGLIDFGNEFLKNVEDVDDMSAQ